jgi:hypothetical protein
VVAKTEQQDAGSPTTLTKKILAPESEAGKSSTLSNPVAALSSVTLPSAESGTPAVTELQPAAPTATDETAASSEKQSNGSYSGVFKPNNPVVLFGTDKGGGADNGIRGWDKVANGIRGALGLPKDDSGSSDGGTSSSGE